MPIVVHAMSLTVSGGSVLSASMSKPKRGSPGRSLMQKNHPASSVGVGAVAALRLRDRQVEAEEVMSGDTRASYSGVLTMVSGGSASCAVVSSTSLRSLRGVCDTVVGLPTRLVRVDDRGRVLLQQLAADHQHDLLLVVARLLAVVVVAELGDTRPAVQLRDVAERLLGLLSRRPGSGRAPDTSQNWRK